MTIGELGDVIGAKRRKVPLKVAWKLSGVMWKLHQAETPRATCTSRSTRGSCRREIEGSRLAAKHSTRATFEIASGRAGRCRLMATRRRPSRR